MILNIIFTNTRIPILKRWTRFGGSIKKQHNICAVFLCSENRWLFYTKKVKNLTFFYKKCFVKSLKCGILLKDFLFGRFYENGRHNVDVRK